MVLSDAGKPGSSADALRPTGQTDHLAEPRGVGHTLCGRSFARGINLTCHKCLEERLKLVHEPAGSAQCSAVQCSVCGRDFKSKGGQAVHRCRYVSKDRTLDIS